MFNKKNNFWVLFLVIVLAFALLYYFLGNAFSTREDYTIYENDKIQVELIPKEYPSSVNSEMPSLKKKKLRSKKLLYPKETRPIKSSAALTSDDSGYPIKSSDSVMKDSKYNLMGESQEEDLEKPGESQEEDLEKPGESLVDEDEGQEEDVYVGKPINDVSNRTKRTGRSRSEYLADRAKDYMDKVDLVDSLGEKKTFFDSAIKKYKEALDVVTDNQEKRVINDALQKAKERKKLILGESTSGFTVRSPQSGGDLEFQYMMERPRWL